MTGRLSRTRRALVITLMALALRRPVAILLLLLLPDAAVDPAAYYATIMLQEALLWGLPALFMLPRRSRDMAACPGMGWGFGMAILGGAAAQVMLAAVTGWWCQVVPVQSVAVPMPVNGAQWVLGTLALAVVPAVTEEAFFRGGFLRGLEECTSRGTAFLLTTLAFALMHGSLAGLPAHLIVSALCTLMMLRWNRVSVCVAFHMSYNATALVLEAAPLDSNAAVTVLLALLLASGTVWLVRGLPARHKAGQRMNIADAVLVGVLLTGMALTYLPELLRLTGRT